MGGGWGGVGFAKQFSLSWVGVLTIMLFIVATNVDRPNGRTPTDRNAACSCQYLKRKGSQCENLYICIFTTKRKLGIMFSLWCNGRLSLLFLFNRLLLDKGGSVQISVDTAIKTWKFTTTLILSTLWHFLKSISTTIHENWWSGNCSQGGSSFILLIF